jgi:hypothetical protein
VSRSGYTDDCDSYLLNLWRANIGRATAGKRGQAFFRALLDALDAMPEHKLTSGELENEEGAVCALGALRVAKGIPLDDSVAESEWDSLGEVFGVAPMLCQEVMYENDEGRRGKETDEERWQRMRSWVADQLKPESAEGQS